MYTLPSTISGQRTSGEILRPPLLRGKTPRKGQNLGGRVRRHTHAHTQYVQRNPISYESEKVGKRERLNATRRSLHVALAASILIKIPNSDPNSRCEFTS